MENSNGSIATPHYLATKAGHRVLNQGGSAVDAVISAAAVLSVVYPHMTGLGGDSWSLIRSPNGEKVAVNGTGRHSASVTASQLSAEFNVSMPQSGAKASPVPGAVSAWSEMHSIAGNMEWSTLFQESIELAATGTEVPEALGRDLAELWGELKDDPGLNEVFGDNQGRPLTSGSILVQPALSESLGLISKKGASVFYEGELSQRLVAGMRKMGSPVTQNDFENQDTEIMQPISREYMGHEIHTAPPNSQGFTLLQILAALQEAGLDLDDGMTCGVISHLFSLANEQRELHLGDPSYAAVDVGQALSSKRIRSLLSRAKFDLSDSANPRPKASGDTVGIVAIDKSGLAVSSLHSIFYAFGARVLEPSTGIILSNRSASFSLVEGHPAYFVPGARPPSTLLPVMVDHPDGTFTAIASMGGRSQAQIQAQLINRIIKGDSPSAAVSRPRFVVGSFGPNLREASIMEPGLPFTPAQLRDSSRFLVLDQAGPDDRCGHAQIIQEKRGTLLTGSDLRADGVERK